MMFDNDASAAPVHGLTCAGKGWARYTLKLLCPVSNGQEWIWPFFTMGSSGLAAAFWGPATDIEQQLDSIPGVVVSEQTNRLPPAHKPLYDFVWHGLVPLDVQLPPLLFYPFGGEDEDGLLLSNGCPRTRWLSVFAGGCPMPAEIREIDDEGAYDRWVTQGLL